jgi:LacI family transcriptional regulator
MILCTLYINWERSQTDEIIKRNMSNSLEDIARIVGVSKSTVSRVVNNHPNVSQHTRERVLAAIREYNFYPNTAARALVTQRTRVLSVIIPQALSSTFTDPYFPALLQSISLTANRHDYAIMLWIGSANEEEERFLNRIISNRLSDGVLIASAIDGDLFLQTLAQTELPFVLTGPSQGNVKHWVDVDNLKGARDAVTHLLSLGRRRIGTITGPLNMGAARHRLEGYREALREAGQLIDEQLIAVANFDEPSAYRAMRQLIECGVDAVFVASDTMALGALRAAAEAGCCVPDDIALVGYDDLPIAATTTPPLTTVHQPISDLARAATELLIRLVEGKPMEYEHMLLSAHLVIRGSCGAQSQGGAATRD